MAELDVGGVKLKGGKGLAILMALGTMIGTLYGGFEVYKDYMDMKDKLANLDVEAIAARNAVLETKLEEAIDYAKDIKDDLRSDVIQVEKALGDVERRIRDVESENRDTIKESKKWFDERTADIDSKLNALEERLNTRLQRALDNPLLKDMKQ
jgi:predicted  nucleic acid-binding Zn-ribbon protein